jgi:hypothetical protein
LGAITLMQAFPLHVVHDRRSPRAFANGQYILVDRIAYSSAGGHEAVRDRFVEDIALAQRVKDLGLPIRVALVQGIVSCRMYASLGQLIRGWSRILYDALGRNTWRLVGKLLDPVIFCQSGHVALLAGLIVLARGGSRTFALSLVGLSIIHHALMFAVFHRVYRQSVAHSRHTAWFPVANVVIDAILLRSIAMCLTGQVTWRGTDYKRMKDEG